MNQVFLPAAKVKARYERSDMSLYRWLHDARMNFPKPYYFSTRRFWKLSELESWEASCNRVSPNDS